MKIPTFIIDDLPRHYKKLEKLFSEYSDFIDIVGKYYGLQPYDSASKFIKEFEKPLLLIIDWDLDEDEKNGLNLFEGVKNYCFAIFCSTWSSAGIINSVSKYTNAAFLVKGAPDKDCTDILSRNELTDILHNRVRPFFEDMYHVELKFYGNGKPGGGNENILERRFLCKNILALKTEGKQYRFIYSEGSRIIEYVGPCNTGGEIIQKIEQLEYSKINRTSSDRPFSLYHKEYYNLSNAKKYMINEDLKAKVPTYFRLL